MATECQRCGHDAFKLRLARVLVEVGDAQMSARVPVQTCLRCGANSVELTCRVEDEPLARPEIVPDGQETG